MIHSILKIHNFGVLLLISLLFLLPSCTQEEEVVSIPPDKMGVVDLIIGTPFPDSSSRMPGDPGTENPEGEDWDTLVLMVVYDQSTPPEYGDSFLTKGLSKKEFDKLDPYPNNNKYRLISWKMPKGKVYVYGCTYSKNVHNAPQFKIDNKKKSCVEIKKEIESLTISNDYAKGSEKSIAQFLSVATGFYDKPVNGQTDGKPDPLIVKSGGQDVGDNFMMRLGRLATKIDMQWDAQDAVSQGITQVRVKNVTFVGGKQPTEGQGGTGATNQQDLGKGRLFPSLVESTAKHLITSQTFYNTSPVSQRNGRVYHYVFPDGVTIPKIQFNLSGKKKDGTNVTPDKNYTITLQTGQGTQPEPLIPGAWYKVNVLIKGFTGNSEITVKYPKDQSSAAGG